MGTTDGSVGDLTALLEPGPASDQCNIVLVAEGFTAAQQGDFDDLCDDFVTTLQTEPWYATAGGGLNIYRLNVSSDQAGTDDPTDCGGDGTEVDTYFDAQFCNSGIRRCLSGSETIVRNELDAKLPQWHVGAVLVNTTDHGGCRSNDVFWTNVGGTWLTTAMHELGHAAFGLADEYDYWAGCETEEIRAGETEPNITYATTRETLKWRHLVSPGVPIPTLFNPDCSMCNTAPNPLSDDLAVGSFEGARYEHCTIFRPAYKCRMRSSAEPFCPVCVEAIAETVGSFLDADGVLEVVPTTLNFGEVAEGLTLYVGFEVRNVRSGHPMPMDVTLAAPNAGFAYAPDTQISFRLPAPVFEAYSSKMIYVAFEATTGAGVVNGSLNVSAEGATETVTLIAEAVPPVPVDSVLVLDRSGSMSDASGAFGLTKMDVAVEAAELYVSLLKENDQIGLVRYNTSSAAGDVLLTPRVAGALGTGAGRQDARNALTPANLNPTGGTSIGSGIINGSNQLDTTAADARALVVLTDGRQNTNPNVADGQAVVEAQSPAQRVFAVGLGLNQLEDTLNEIASVTNGVAQVTGDLVDEREFLLQKLFVQIMSDVSDEAFVRDPVEEIRPTECRATSVYLSEIDVACDFIVTWRASSTYPKYLQVWLEAPNGDLFQTSTTAPAIDVVLEAQHLFFRVQLPVVTGAVDGDGAPVQLGPGRWKVWVEALRQQSEFQPNLVYTVMAKARSNLLAPGRVEQDTYEPGSEMRIVIEPHLFGRPVALDRPVAASVTRPDGVKTVVPLERDGDGYLGRYSNTPFPGTYRVEYEVNATSPAGHRVTRFRSMSGLIFRRRTDGGGGSGGGGGNDGGSDGSNDGCLTERECRIAGAALAYLAHLLRKCCATKRKTGVASALSTAARSFARRNPSATLSAEFDDLLNAMLEPDDG